MLSHGDSGEMFTTAPRDRCDPCVIHVQAQKKNPESSPCRLYNYNETHADKPSAATNIYSDLSPSNHR